MAGSDARRRIAEKRKAEIEAEHRKKRRNALLMRIGIPVVVIVIIAVVFAVVANLPHNSASSDTSSSATAVVSTVTSVPASALDSVGVGAAQSAPKAITAPALTKNGLPHFVYIGAEYCPYCAAERWPVTVALARFGTFSNVGLTTSSSTDAYPNTPTLTFHGATYQSKYVAFTGKEIQDRTGKALETLNSSQQALMKKYDSPPYTSSAGPIPFIDIAGKYLISGASYDPQLLQGKTHKQIADALADPSSSIAKSVDGVANVITAAICTTTDQQPAKVCTSSGVKAAAGLLK